MRYHEQLANLSLWFWIELTNHLWQSTLFLLLIFVIIAILRGATAKSRYTVWLVASTKFAMPLSVFVTLGQWLNLNTFFPYATAVEASISRNVNLVGIASQESVSTGIISITETATKHNEIYCLLTLLWVVGCLSLIALWWRQSQLFKASLGCKNMPTSEREIDLLNDAQARFGLTTRVNLIISDSILEPIVLGVWRPAIIIPTGLSQKLTDDELKMVMMHELSHIARRDNLIGIMQMALCCLLWFHPFIWLIKRKLLEERELACDEAVIRHENEPHIYASGLLKVVQFGLHLHQSAGLANAAGANLTKRLELIMKNKAENTKIRWQQLIVGTTVVALILVCLVASLVTTQASSVKDNLEPEDKAELIQQIQDWADVSYRVVGENDSPLKIIEARGKEVSNSQFTKITGKVIVGTLPGGATYFPNIYSVPKVKMVNTSGKIITGLMVAVIDPQPDGKAKLRGMLEGKVVENFPAISIASGETYTIDFKGNHALDSEYYWLEFTNPSNFYVAVVKVQFDDNTSWTIKEGIR